MDIIIFLQSLANPFLDVFFSIITNLGAQTLGIFVGIILFWCGNKKTGYRFMYGVIFSFSLNNIIKIIVKAPRPIGTPGINSSQVSTATGYSFPSGHSQGNSTTFTLLMGILKSKGFWCFGIIMMILVPISRLYFGVHWPIDVIFGTILGILSVLVSNRLFDYFEHKKPRYILLSFIPFMILGLFFPSNDLYKALGAFTAFCIGYIIEKKYIKFTPNSSLGSNLKKIAIGLLGALIIYIGFEKLLSGLWIDFIKYFSITFWGIVICPIIFKKLHLCSD
ncbi:MAG: phosphatase PAP2 family protein [Clostridium sp.]